MNSAWRERLDRLKARARILLGLDYRHKGDLYWFALAIPEFFLLLFLLYLTLMIMARHVYGYFDPEAYFDFPGKSVLYYFAGETTTEEQKIDELGLESDLMKGVFRTPKRTRYEHFHFIVEPRAQGNEDACFICHGEFPHSEDKAVRSTLNMHTEFVACVTCHATLEEAQARTYQWINSSGIEVTGPPLGTRYDELGGLVRTDDHYSKITPFREVDGELVSIAISEDSAEARDYLRVREMLTRDQQTVAKKKFHENIEKDAIHCDNCHAVEQEGVVPFEALGFDEKRARDLRSENLPDTVEPNNDFYFPAILREKEPSATTRLMMEQAEDSSAAEGAPAATAGSTDEEDLNWWEKREREKKRRGR